MSNDLSMCVDVVSRWRMKIQDLIKGHSNLNCELMEVQISIGERMIRNFVARGYNKGSKWEAQIGDGDGIMEWFNTEPIPMVEDVLLHFMECRLKAFPSTPWFGEKSEEELNLENYADSKEYKEYLASMPDPESFIGKEE